MGDASLQTSLSTARSLENISGLGLNKTKSGQGRRKPGLSVSSRTSSVSQTGRTGTAFQNVTAGQSGGTGDLEEQR